MIFQHQNSFGVAGQLVPIQNGLRNWIAIWERYFDLWSTSYPYGGEQDAQLSLETMWKRVGFVRFSPEYWLLGTLLTDRIVANATALPQGLYSDEADEARARAEGRTAASGRIQARSVDPILDKYDQTSMRQVNDLITNFQRFHVD